MAQWLWTAASVAWLGTGALGYAGQSCHGYDEVWGLCPKTQPCDSCEPVDCEFGEWGDWFAAGGCTGLLYHQRTVKVSNNECGTPCNGSKIESKVDLNPECTLTKQNCVMSGWSKWSGCAADTDQNYRVRTILKTPSNGGDECSGVLKETKPCGTVAPPQDCQFGAWQSWTSCSASCGVGRHTRMRRVAQIPTVGGKECKDSILETGTCEEKVCPLQDCVVSDWGLWSHCNPATHPQQERVRHVLKESKGDGQRCDAVLIETIGCGELNSTDCVLSRWSDWSPCDRDCNGGQTYRKRHVVKPSSDGGHCSAAHLRETEACNTQRCTDTPDPCTLNAWSEWSQCCVGSMTRSRQIQNFADPRGEGCRAVLEEAKECNQKDTDKCKKVDVDCLWSDWFEWSGCSCSCGGGTKRRNRMILKAPREEGKACEPRDKAEAKPCNTEPCPSGCVDGRWGKWQAWAECSATCSGGYRMRRRDLDVEPSACGMPAVGLREEFQACSFLPPCEPNKDCLLSEWGMWSDCSCTCAGVRDRNRYIRQFSQGNGTRCVETSLKETSPCNPGPGESFPPACNGHHKKDCKLTSWVEGTCSKTCGGGQVTSERKIEVFPSNGGKPCSGDLIITRPCNTQSCGVPETCVDCKWGEWGNWGDCSKCGGQRWRQRTIETMNNHCGRACDPASAKEISKCESDCAKNLFCSWHSWSASSGCGECGTKTGMRNRALGMREKLPDENDALFITLSNGKCSGTELNYTLCEEPASCKKTCTPRNCEFGSWQEWSSPSCTGLCERARVIQTMNNECGDPCNGVLMETKRCETNCTSRDCVLSEWEEWSTCAKGEHGQRERMRTIRQTPEGDGKACEGPLLETKSCVDYETIPCKLSEWQTWSKCPVTCGGSTQMRNRRIVEHAIGGGILCHGSLEELQPCGATPCPSPDTDCVLDDWSQWSSCGGGCGGAHQRERKRAIKVPPESGIPCLGALEETESCGFERVDCSVSDWTEWDTCQRTCGGGEQLRQRQIHRFPERGGTPCPEILMETKGCHLEPCGHRDCQIGDWSEWSTCSTSCGVGQRARRRDVLHNRNKAGIGCLEPLEMTEGCPNNPDCGEVDCEWDDWSDWGGCSCSCDGGQQTRNRHIKRTPRNFGKACKPEDRDQVQPCNTQKCHSNLCRDGKWGVWSAWSPCSATCKSGVTFRARKVAVMANDCGEPAVGTDHESKFCNVDVPCTPPLDCEFSDWGPWSDCSTTCHGVKRRSRRISQYGRGDGAYCKGALKQSWPCNPSPGGVDPAGCLPEKHTDCQLSRWAAWSQCSASCGGGQRTRKRHIEVYPSGQGKACCEGGEDPTVESDDSDMHSDAPTQDMHSDAPPQDMHSDAPPQARRLKMSANNSKDRRLGGYRFHIGGIGGSVKEDQGGCALGQIQECGRDACEGPEPVDCEFGMWEEWGACDKCSGQRKRFRSILRYAEHGGEPCELTAAAETGACDRKCEDKTWCTWDHWGDWTKCRSTCGTEKRSRRRYLTVSTTEADGPVLQSEVLQRYSEAIVAGSADGDLEHAGPRELLGAFAVGCTFCGVVGLLISALSGLSLPIHRAGTLVNAIAEEGEALTSSRMSSMSSRANDEMPLLS